MGRFGSLTEAAAALRRGETTAVALTESALAAARTRGEALGTFVTRFEDSARSAAAEADRELADGFDRGRLHGIPVGVKDLIATAEGPTTANSRLRLDRVEPDATVVARLRAGGAVICGKTTTMEFGCGVPDGSGPFPLPRNPWDTTRWAGGSSSGSANGIVAGCFAAGIGSDTAGSIRMPAAFCGVTGLMPTFDRVPRTGCVGLAASLDRIGPIARDAVDCAAVLAVIGARSRPGFTGDPVRALPDLETEPAGLRLGVCRDWSGDARLMAAFETAVAQWARLGVDVVEVRLPLWRELTEAVLLTAATEGYARHRADFRRRPHDYLPSTRALLGAATGFDGADYLDAQALRRTAARELHALFEEVDAVVTPTALAPAPRLTALTDERGHQRPGLLDHVDTPYWNGVANPVLALPIGFDAAGLPLSVQLAAAPNDDATVLRLGAAYQRVTDWHRRSPFEGDRPVPGADRRRDPLADRGGHR